MKYIPPVTLWEKNYKIKLWFKKMIYHFSAPLGVSHKKIKVSLNRGNFKREVLGEMVKGD